MKRQRGLTLIGLIFMLMLGGLTLLVAAKLMPVYLEFYAVKRLIHEISSSGDNSNPKSIQAAFDRRANIESITSIRGNDLQIDKAGNGYAISAAWERKVPIVSNVSALMEFEVES